MNGTANIVLRPLLVLFVLLATVHAVAEPGPRHDGPRMDIDKLGVLLDLDDYQKQEVDAILTAKREAAEAKREEFRASGTRPDRETMKAEREAMRAATLDELAAVLTPDQLEKFELLMEQQRPRGPRHEKDAEEAPEAL